QRRARRRAALEHGVHLRHPARRGLLGSLRHRMGRRALVHRVRAAHHRLYDDPVRGQAGRHAGRRRVLAGHRRTRRQDAVHRPDAFRAIRREDPSGSHIARHDLSGFRYLFLAGERLDPETYHWANDLLGVPVIDHWWQTETGWPIAANLMGLEPRPTKPGSATVPVPGYDVRVVD